MLKYPDSLGFLSKLRSQSMVQIINNTVVEIQVSQVALRFAKELQDR